MGKFVNKLAGKTIVVVGGSTGIGFGVAEAVASLDAKVIIISSREEKVKDALRRLKEAVPENKDIVGHVSSVTDPEFVTLLRSLGPIDHLVYSAVDWLIRGPTAELNVERAKEGFEIKFWGAVTSATTVAKYDLIRPGGSITLTSGTAGLRPGPGAAVGGALNGAVIAFTRGLAIDLAPKRIRVNTVIPGVVVTELWTKLVPSVENRQQVLENSKKKLLVPEVGTPEDVAESYVYFLRSDYSTGQTLVIDGGGLLA